MRGDSSAGILSMAVNTAYWTRSLSIQFWTEGEDKLLLRILSPKKEMGTSTLRSGQNIWNYLPKTNRVIKLPSVSLSSSWMGSHFTYDDLLKDSSLADDFDYEVTAEKKQGTASIVEITCVPKTGLPVVWGAVKVMVNTLDSLPLSIRYYDEDGLLVRTLAFSDVGMIGGTRLPRRHRMIPADRPEEFTDVVYKKLTFDPVLEENVFSLRNIKQFPGFKP